MTNKVLILVGTKKGAFILESDAARQSWELRGPFCETWPMNHVIADPATGTIYGGGGSEWFGPAVWKSTDLGATWTHSSVGMAYPEGEEPIKSVWSVAKNGTSLYAGVEPAGLFRSDDGGKSWNHVPDCGTTRHGRIGIRAAAGSSCTRWSCIPATTSGYGPGSPPPGCSTRLTAARHGKRATGGPGPTFCRRARTTRNSANAFIASSWRPACRTGSISKITAACTAATMAASDGRASRRVCHRASAFRRRPTRATRQRFTCCRSTATRRAGMSQTARRRSGGRGTPASTWEDLRDGLPQEQYVFRRSAPSHGDRPAGACRVYFGTSTGALFASADEGDSWTCVAQHLPTILSVETLVVEA